MKKQLLSIILALLPMLAMADASGWCGEHVTYTYNSTTKTLTIQGSGAMEDYKEYDYPAPWHYICTNINTVIIKEGVTSIGRYAFDGCSGLTSVTIPNSVTSIARYAFYGCSGLQKVIVPDIAAWCGINYFNYESNPLYYAHHIYSDKNTEIKDLVIPNSVTSIGGGAFYGCSGLTSVTIGNSVTSIGSEAFSGCTGLQKVIVPDIAAWYGISFADNRANPLYYAHHIYSDKNTEITEIVIPEGVNIIGMYAFYNCENITSVTIPSSVTRIGSNAFSCGIKLSEVNVNMNIPIEITESVFQCTGGIYSSDIIYLVATLKVPNGSKNLYSNVNGWKKFANIQEVDFSGVETIKQKSTPTSYYSVSGEKLNNVHRGVNIVRMSDGTTRKVVVK